MKHTILRLLQDESGDDLIEYALLTTAIGLVGAAGIAALTNAIHNTYRSWNYAQQNIWQMPNPGVTP